MSADAQSEPIGRALPPLKYLAPAVGLLTGYLAVQLETRYAPVGVFPLAVGAATGLGVAAILRLAGTARRRTHVVAATLAALLAVVAMHYLEFRRAQEQSRKHADHYAKAVYAFPEQKTLTAVKPLEGFGEFVRRDWDIGRPLGPLMVRGPWLGLWWTLDALLVWLGATVIAVMLSVPQAKHPPADAGGSSGAAT